jgi:hypothetical protein
MTHCEEWTNLEDSSREDYGSKRAVLPMMMMIMMTARKKLQITNEQLDDACNNSLHSDIFKLLRSNLLVRKSYSNRYSKISLTCDKITFVER